MCFHACFFFSCSSPGSLLKLLYLIENQRSLIMKISLFEFLLCRCVVEKNQCASALPGNPSKCDWPFPGFYSCISEYISTRLNFFNSPVFLALNILLHVQSQTGHFHEAVFVSVVAPHLLWLRGGRYNNCSNTHTLPIKMGALHDTNLVFSFSIIIFTSMGKSTQRYFCCGSAKCG